MSFYSTEMGDHLEIIIFSSILLILLNSRINLRDLATLETYVYSDRKHWNLQRSLTQLVSTSNKRSSSGEMKKRPEEGWNI